MFLCRNQPKGLREIFPKCMSWTPLVSPPGGVTGGVAPINVASTQSRRTLSGRRHQRTTERSQSIHTADIVPGPTPRYSERVVDLAVAFSQRPLNGGGTAMHYTDYPDVRREQSRTGRPEVGAMTKLAIADTYGLSRRDLRVFDQPSAGAPHILVRPSSILVHLFDLRAVVRYDHVRLFHITQAHGQEPVAETERARASGNDNGDAKSDSDHCVSRVFTHIMKEGTRNGHHQPGGLETTHYELYALDVALSSVTSVLEAEYLLTQRKVAEALQMTDASTLSGEESTMHSGLRTTLELKRKLTSIEQRARQIQSMSREILNEDEDMANMYLTDKHAGNPHAVHDHQSVEYLFEAYFKASDTIAGQAASLISRIRRTEETVQYTLSVRRNQIMVLEARLEILMLALAGATLVAGWYGMNLVNYSEKSPHAFSVVVLVSCVAVLVSSGWGMRRLWRIRTAQLRT
ncbi:hypothetical protein BJX68DRAFT_235093 [Aspergillus pseudodeflectus]|uniref:Magnesium transporter n=1 Tax=Aspergillus pseudodeflectus TaxID=176178 RepID=A0ABR4KIZ1_9EURO